MRAGAILAALAILCSGNAWADEGHGQLEKRMRQQLARRPGDLEARFGLARALAWQGRYDEAEAEFFRLLKARPNNADFLLGLAQVRLWRGTPGSALPPLQKARRIAPRYAEVWRTEIKALLAQGGPDRLRQARALRQAAGRHFPGADWTFPQLDAPPAAALAESPRPTPAREAAAPAVAAPELQLQVPQAAPATEAPDRLEWEAGYSRESLTRGQPDWTSRYLLGQWRRQDNRTLYGGLRETERYALADREIHLGGSLPPGTASSFQLEGGFSDTHRVLPGHYVQAQLQHKMSESWSLGAGLRHAEYDDGATRVANAAADYYLGAERFSYTLYLGGPENAALAPSHRWQWAHYYGDRDWFGLTIVRGRETEHAAGGFLSSQIHGASLSGTHSFLPDWAASWEAGSLRQGDFYTRRGLRIGLRHTF